MSVFIRTAEKKDVESVTLFLNRLVEHISETTKDPYWTLCPDYADKNRLYIESFIVEENKAVYVADSDGKTVGFIAGEIRDSHLPISEIQKIGYISAAYVDEEYRRLGILRLLDNEINTFFTRNGLRFTELDYLAQNSLAERAWRSLGYGDYRIHARKSIGENKRLM